MVLSLTRLIAPAVLNYALGNVEGICTLEQKQRFSCPGGRVFFSASIIWGLLGPQRMFSPGQIYSALLFFFPAGAIVTILLHYAGKKIRPLRFAMAPLIFGGGQGIPPASPLNFMTWGIVGFIFQKYIRTRHFRWWSRLNYLTAVGLDTGLAISSLTIFFLIFGLKAEAPTWWYVFSLSSDVKRHFLIYV